LASAQHFFIAAQHPAFASVAQQDVLAMAFAEPQHVLASLQQARASWQHLLTAAQQPLLSAQHFRLLLQQPTLASAAQQPLLDVQQARLAAQQSAGLSAAAPTPVNNSPRARNEPANNLVNMVILQ
jgi:hypothetical protein